MMSRHCFRPTVRFCTGLFVLAFIFISLILVDLNIFCAVFLHRDCISALSENHDAGSREAQTRDGKALGNCSLQRTNVTARVSGNLAKVTVTQNSVSPNFDSICEATMEFAKIAQEAATSTASYLKAFSCTCD